MVALFLLSSWESPPDLGAGTDKEVHWMLYLGLSALVVRALARGEWRGVTWGRVIGAIVLSALYGASDEFHQRFVPGRTPDVLDLAADTAGASVAAVAIWLWSKIKHGADRL
jgi:VanZ family protein